MSGHVTITLTAAPYRTTIKGLDERLCCIQAENVYRAWLKQGYGVQTRVACTDPVTQVRIRDYLLDVLRESTHDMLLDTQPGLAGLGLLRETGRGA